MTLALPLTPLARPFHFDPLPVPFFLLIGAVVLLYATAAEVVKRVFHKENPA